VSASSQPSASSCFSFKSAGKFWVCAEDMMIYLRKLFVFK